MTRIVKGTRVQMSDASDRKTFGRIGTIQAVIDLPSVIRFVVLLDNSTDVLVVYRNGFAPLPIQPVISEDREKFKRWFDMWWLDHANDRVVISYADAMFDAYQKGKADK